MNNANERFEYMAELFYQETGFMAPGKDSCAAFGVVDTDERDAKWKIWVEEFYIDMFEDHKIKTDFIKNTK